MGQLTTVVTIDHAESSAETADTARATRFNFISNAFGKLERLGLLSWLGLVSLSCLNLNALGTCEVLVADTGRREFFEEFFIFLFADIVRNKGLLAKERPVEIVLPGNM
jgi:hypothetical protein